MTGPPKPENRPVAASDDVGGETPADRADSVGKGRNSERAEAPFVGFPVAPPPFSDSPYADHYTESSAGRRQFASLLAVFVTGGLAGLAAAWWLFASPIASDDRTPSFVPSSSRTVPGPAPAALLKDEPATPLAEARESDQFNNKSASGSGINPGELPYDGEPAETRSGALSLRSSSSTASGSVSDVVNSQPTPEDTSGNGQANADASGSADGATQTQTAEAKAAEAKAAEAKAAETKAAEAKAAEAKAAKAKAAEAKAAEVKAAEAKAAKAKAAEAKAAEAKAAKARAAKAKAADAKKNLARVKTAPRRSVYASKNREIERIKQQAADELRRNSRRDGLPN